MGNMGYTCDFTQGYRYALVSNYCVAAIRGKQRIVQFLARQFVGGCQLVFRDAKYVGIRNGFRSRLVGEDNLSVSSNQKNCRIQTIKRIRKFRRRIAMVAVPLPVRF